MVSLDTLDDEKRDVLSQYQSITQTNDLEEALGQLIEHDWNLEKAVQNKYENNVPTEETRQELEEQVANSTGTAVKRDISTMYPPPTATPTTQPTVRPSSIGHNNAFRPNSSNRPFSIFTILYWPFGLAWNITWSILSFASRFMFNSPLGTISNSNSNKRSRDPRVLAFEFIEKFEEKYGKNHVEFFKGGYSQALEKARRELRFMLVILQSDDHDDTAAFNKDTLTSDRLKEFIKEKNILVWAGNVHESEAHKVSYALQGSTYPFIALIALQTSYGNSIPKMTVIERIEGPSHPQELISQIDIAIERQGAVVNRLKNERNQRELERQLLKDQDAAYHQSLKADQEKARLAQEEKEAQLKAEEEAKQALLQIELLKEKKKQYINYLYHQLPKEPTETDNSKVAKLSFRLADGDRVVRKFNQDDTIDTLYRFVQVYPLLKGQEEVEKVNEPPADYTHNYKFTIHSPYPRMEYEPDNKTKLSDIKSLWPSATLVVDSVDDDEEEEQ